MIICGLENTRTAEIQRQISRLMNLEEALLLLSRLKSLFTGYGSFADKIAQKASSISNAAARTKGVDKTYNKQGVYSDTISKLFKSTIDKTVGDKVNDKDKDKDEDESFGKTSSKSQTDTK